LAPPLAARFAGPGGCYNVGNALCLATSIALPALEMAGRGVSGNDALAAAVVETLAGNAASIALTVATGVFFWSGEIYHRAWAHGAPPDASLNRQGDFVSGVGSVVFGTAMMGFGQSILAAASGLLMAAGKFGSAAGRTSFPGWPSRWQDPFRAAVLVSRVPAIIATLVGLVGALTTLRPTLSAVLGPGVLLVSLGLWVRADLLLFAPASPSNPKDTDR
jgi:hypothetical protein